ncbi:hypothetical protein GWI33_011944 [Rhynchophorus ferrugineus]|uniref:Uncharacterized protein n=1 Tax=Rhynchophorus ferrugineus TaxID=354439 RepID=A0A834IU05_RHYFE|nr:hypothetical protein GWI33_011944 [Rhynchophorus ferrugineus]
MFLADMQRQKRDTERWRTGDGRETNPENGEKKAHKKKRSREERKKRNAARERDEGHAGGVEEKMKNARQRREHKEGKKAGAFSGPLSLLWEANSGVLS